MLFSEKYAKNLLFWSFFTILAQNGQFWTDAAQNVQFSSFPEKIKTSLFTLHKTSIHAKNQGNPMCGFLEKLTRQRETRQYLMVRIARWASDQKSENSNARIFGKMGTNIRTDGRTNGGESKGPSTPSRDQKVMNGFRERPLQMDGRRITSKFLLILRRTNKKKNKILNLVK